jgi:hypothetical protein
MTTLPIMPTNGPGQLRDPLFLTKLAGNQTEAKFLVGLCAFRARSGNRIIPMFDEIHPDASKIAQTFLARCLCTQAPLWPPETIPCRLGSPLSGLGTPEEARVVRCSYDLAGQVLDQGTVNTQAIPVNIYYTCA